MEGVHILHKKLAINGLKRHYTFLHISDTHVIRFGETETKSRIQEANARLAAFSKDGIAPDVRFRRYIELADRLRVSGVVMTGDMIDFPSPENLAFLRDSLAALKMPYLYVPGNHDWSYSDHYHTRDSMMWERPLLASFCGGDTEFHIETVGELTFAALDNSMDCYRPETVVRLKNVLDSSENVIILQHVPFYCDTLHEDTVSSWKRDITLGGAGIVLDDSAKEIQTLLTASPAVKAVLCGHLHFAHEDRVGGILPQYVGAAGYGGEAALFEIC